MSTQLPQVSLKEKSKYEKSTGRVIVTINRQWLLAERPTGMVGLHNFNYIEMWARLLSSPHIEIHKKYCLLYTSDAADE